MGWPLIAIGLILLVTGVRDQVSEFNALLASDIQGGPDNNFLAFIVAIGVLSAIGSVKNLRGFSDAFLGLIFLVLLLSNRGFFAEFQRQIKEP